MNQNNNGNENSNNNNGGPVKPTWGGKVGYIGTGVLIGLIIYPFVRKALGKMQPKVDELFDNLTGRAEDLAEKASDFMAKAKDNLYKTDSARTHSTSTHSDTVQ